MYMYIYIYIEREREIEIGRIYIYIYIYIYGAPLVGPSGCEAGFASGQYAFSMSAIGSLPIW